MTLRELLVMAEARSRDEWARMSSLMALLASCNSKKTFQPRDFNPFAKLAKPIAADIGVLKDVFFRSGGIGANP